jgi:hypothetical protein
VVGSADLSICRRSKCVRQLFQVTGGGLATCADGILGLPSLVGNECVVDLAKRKLRVGDVFAVDPEAWMRYGRTGGPWYVGPLVTAW